MSHYFAAKALSSSLTPNGCFISNFSLVSNLQTYQKTIRIDFRLWVLQHSIDFLKPSLHTFRSRHFCCWTQSRCLIVNKNSSGEASYLSSLRKLAKCSFSVSTLRRASKKRHCPPWAFAYIKTSKVRLDVQKPHVQCRKIFFQVWVTTLVAEDKCGDRLVRRMPEDKGLKCSSIQTKGN